jgi:hypothetical protein
MGSSHLNNHYEFIHSLNLKGFLPNDISLHPNLLTFENQIHNYNFEILPQQFDPSLFGIKLLGTYIGNNEYILNKINKYINELTIFAQKLIDFPHHQSRQLM